MKKAEIRSVEVRSMDGWRSNALPLSLEKGDLDLLDNVLCFSPELRAAFLIGREARRRGLTYPVTSAKQLARLLQGESFSMAGHAIDARSITQALAKEWFPLTHEGEFLSAVHLGLRRCQAERAAALMEGIKHLPKSRAAKAQRRR